MGKGQIIAHKGDGLYDVRLTYAYRSRITSRLATYTVQIAEFDVKIAAETDVNKKALLKLQRASVQKLYDYYSTKMPDDPTVEAWCADLTEDLAYGTIVGTVEIPGEQVTVLVRPSYNGRSIYSAARDGQLMPAIAGSPHQVLFNWMMLPGWQRHKPIYRTGTISAIDYNANTGTVCLDQAFSSQQNLPAIDGIGVADCGATALAGAADFCSRYPTHPFCTNSEEGTEIELSTAQLAQLQAVNQDVNLNYGRQGDPSGYTTGDSWDVMSTGGAGDCEDFALTKMQILVDSYGWNPRDLKLVTAYTKTGVYHAMLGVRTTNYGLMILDVNNDPVVSSTKLPYKIDRIALTKTSWKNYTRKLTAVPVEYMGCNSLAFTAGDRVVVQFIDQKWTTPKVVGFAEAPQSCLSGTFVFSGFGYNGGAYASHGVIRISQSLEVSINLALMPNQDSYNHMAAYSLLKFQVCGGRYRDGYTTFYSSNYQYDYFADSFATVTPMSADRFYGDGFSLNDKSFIVAGVNSAIKPPFLPIEWNFDQSLIEYSVTVNSWTSRSSFGSNRLGIQSFVVENAAYFFSGFNDSNIPNPPSRISKKYLATTDTWSDSVAHPEFNTWFSAVFSALDIGVVVGGVDGENTGGSPVSSYDVNGYNSVKTWKIDPVAGVWSSGTDFALSGSIRSMGSDGKANLGFVIGGDEYADSPSSWGTPYRTYNPLTDTWTTIEIQHMIASAGAAITA